MKGSSKESRNLWLRALVWSVMMVILWLPGLGTSVSGHGSHVDYRCGILGYYVVVREAGREVGRGFDARSLLCTCFLTFVCSAGFLEDYYRQVRCEGKPSRHSDLELDP